MVPDNWKQLRHRGRGTSATQLQISMLKRLRLSFSEEVVRTGIPLAEAYSCLQLAILTSVFIGHRLSSSVSPSGSPGR